MNVSDRKVSTLKLTLSEVDTFSESINFGVSLYDPSRGVSHYIRESTSVRALGKLRLSDLAAVGYLSPVGVRTSVADPSGFTT